MTSFRTSARLWEGFFHAVIFTFFTFTPLFYLVHGPPDMNSGFSPETGMVLNNVRGEEMGIELVHIGFGNILAMGRVIAIASPNSAPTKRTIHEGRNNGKVIDMTSGRRTKAVIFTDSGHIVLAALAPETIASRLQLSRLTTSGKQEQIDTFDEP